MILLAQAYDEGVPELPDVELYITKLKERIIGQPLRKVRLVSMFLLRTVAPPISSFEGLTVVAVSRLGKRIVLEFGEDGPFLVIHLMIAGRFQWRPADAKPLGKITLACFDFPTGTLILTEASKKRRAGLYAVANRDGLTEYDPGGIEPLTCGFDQFQNQIKTENRTLKRALTNPRMFSGIGNAYSDEICFVARLSPLRLTTSLNEEEVERLHDATVTTLISWRDKLLVEFATKFPGAGDVTAFQPDFAVHGRYGLPCPVCGHKIQRIVYAENETNYCAHCQNEGRLLADRSLSRLLKDDWPKTIEEMDGA